MPPQVVAANAIASAAMTNPKDRYQNAQIIGSLLGDTMNLDQTASLALVNAWAYLGGTDKGQYVISPEQKTNVLKRALANEQRKREALEGSSLNSFKSIFGYGQSGPSAVEKRITELLGS